VAEKIAPIPTTPLYNYNTLSASNVSGDVASKPLETFVNKPDTRTPTTPLYNYNTLAQGSAKTTTSSTTKKVVNTFKNADGTITIVYDDGTTEITGTPDKSTDNLTKDAYALIEDTLNTYGLSELSSVIKGYMLQGIGPEQAKLLIKQDPIYKARFKGNELRLASGLNALTEAEYLGLEDTYSQVMKQYGLGDYFGTTRAARQTKLADVIGGDISPVELKSRISTVVDRVNNAEPAIKAQLKEFYPGITETDLVKYFLDPKQTLPQLNEKVTSAEIGAAASAQGLNTNMTSASDLARYGVDRATAIKGYSTIGGLLPEAQKLSGIYGEAGIDYTQKTAEEEVFKGNASAERKRKQLAALETAQFSGSAGLGSAGLSTQMLRKSSSGGQF
jgi:hypothetical protein